MDRRLGDTAAPRRRISTGFTAATTADEVLAGVDLTGLRAVVTGGGSGLGLETGRALDGAGAAVTLAVRDVDSGREAARRLSPRTRIERLDLADLDSVDAFCERWRGPLHLLVNNAGIMRLPDLRRTADGVELQLATNHLGHFAMASGLRSALRDGAADRGGARIVAVASRAHLDAPVDFEDLSFDRRPYDPALAYGQSKTANVLFAVGATQQWAEDGVTANALNPGGVATGLQRHLPTEVRAAMAAGPLKSLQQGAATTLVAAVSPAFAGTGGHYLEDATEAETVPDDAPPTSGVRGWALDPDLADRLWTVSTALLARR